MGRKILINKNQLKESLFIVLLLYTFLGNAQNLVTNPGFEDIDSCYGQPADTGFDVFNWAGCKGWSNPIKSSSDLWCQNPIVGSIVPPQMYLTYQHPFEGNNMAGILLNGGVIFNWREYIQNALTDSLSVGVEYDISFYISGNTENCMTNQFGVKFFNQVYYEPDSMWLTHFQPDAVNSIDQVLFDTTIWQKLEMKYTAKGGESYVVIGNFQDSLSMSYTLPCDTSFWNGMTLGGGYFLIDNVVIERARPDAKIPNVFTPNGDGINDVFAISVSNCTDWELHILNRWGNSIAICTADNPEWVGLDANEGTYFYVLKSDTCDLNKHGFFQLIR
jgi:gliding motility-associated-like protein